MASIVPLFPNWIVRHMRSPNLHTAAWLKRPVEVFFISPKMTKLELREYLRVLYDIPVSKVRARERAGHRVARGGSYVDACAGSHGELPRQDPAEETQERQVRARPSVLARRSI